MKTFVHGKQAKRALLIAVLLVVAFAAAMAAPAPVQVTAETKPHLAANYGKFPLSFEPNRGQTDGRVKFLSRGKGYQLFLTPTEAVLALRRAGEEKNSSPDLHALLEPRDARTSSAATSVLRMRLAGANRLPEIAGNELLPGQSNYFIGDDPAQWRTHVPNYKAVEYRNVYPGISLTYYGSQRQLEFDFRVEPGADPGAIRMAFAGVRHMRMDSDGDMVLATPGGEVRQQKPVVYQEVDGVRHEVAGRFKLMAGHRVGFAIAKYDHSKPLVIDPVLVYSTYLGGSAEDLANAIAVDSSGNAYVSGRTSSATDFPQASLSSIQAKNGGGPYDAFVAKISADGSTVIWSTYLGGTGDDEANAIAVDSSGNVYVAGFTSSSDFPKANAIQAALNGAPDAFVAKISADGSTLDYSTYLGGSSSDAANGIAVDSSGNAYVTGGTTSTDFPGASSSTIQNTNHGNGDAFVAKLNAAGSALVYSTYLGGAAGDQANGITVDAAGNAYITGLTFSTDFPTQNPLQVSSGGGKDAFVTKINSAGSALVWSTYFGGSGDDYGSGIAVDSAGNAYVAGTSSTTGFVADPAFAHLISAPCSGFGPDHALAFKVKNDGSALVWGTFLAGCGVDRGLGIAVDLAGNAYVVGWTNASDFDPIKNAVQSNSGGGADAFVAKINAAGTLPFVYGTYLGGSGGDFGQGIAVDATGAYVAGYTTSSNFPTASPLQPALSGSTDAFVAKIEETADLKVQINPAATVSSFNDGTTVPYHIDVTNNGPEEALNVVVTDTLPASLTLQSGCSFQGGTCSTSGNTATATLAALGAGQKAEATVFATVNCNVANSTQITDSASVTAGQIDPDLSNNTGSWPFTALNPAPVLSSCPGNQTVVATSSAGAVVTYAGPVVTNAFCPAAQAVVSCTPPSGSTFPIGVTTANCTATNAGGATGSCAPFTETVLTTDLAISKAGTPNPVKVGAIETYTLTVHNNSTTAGATAAGIVVTDVLAPGISTFASVGGFNGGFSLANCSYPPVGSSGTVTCSLGGLAPGGTASFQLKATITARGKTTIGNTATVSSTTYDPYTVNNSATVTTRIYGSQK